MLRLCCSRPRLLPIPVAQAKCGIGPKGADAIAGHLLAAGSLMQLQELDLQVGGIQGGCPGAPLVPGWFAAGTVGTGRGRSRGCVLVQGLA